jgi:predicted GNAT superfamily acetyltransferase
MKLKSPKSSRRPSILVRKCHRIEEFESCVELERKVWQSADIDIVPIPLFVVATETGGHVLGAYEGKKLVGFTLAVAGWRDRKPYLHSHMTAVHSAYRDRGIGRQLKLFQRKDALSRGISLVEWTFDPLAPKNAYFNLMSLGAVVRRYLPNAYGITTSPLHGGIPTDRLIAEWHLRSPRVRRVLAGKPPTASMGESAVRITIPGNLETLREAEPAQVVEVQSRVRKQFARWLAKKYAATAVVASESGMDYILEPWKNTHSK